MESLIYTQGGFVAGLLVGAFPNIYKYKYKYTNTNTNTQGGFGEGPLDGAFPLPSLERSGLPGQVRADPEFEHSSFVKKGFSGTYGVFFLNWPSPISVPKRKLPIRAFLGNRIL